MNGFLYALETLIEAGAHYQNRKITLDEYKASVYETAEALTALEDKDLRIHLKQQENDLDSMQFTIDEDKLFEATLPLVELIAERARKALERWKVEKCDS